MSSNGFFRAVAFLVLLLLIIRPAFAQTGEEEVPLLLILLVTIIVILVGVAIFLVMMIAKKRRLRLGRPLQKIAQQQFPVQQPPVPKKSVFKSAFSKVKGFRRKKVSAAMQQNALPRRNFIEKVSETAIDHDPRDGFSEEIKSLFDEATLAKAKLNSIGAIFSRNMVHEIFWNHKGQKEERTRIVLEVNKAFLKETKSITVVDVMPKTIMADLDKVSSSLPFEKINETAIQFTVKVDQNIVYFVNEKINTDRIVEFNAPIILGINLG